MTLSELLDELKYRNVRLYLQNGRLRCKSPPGALTPGLKAALQAYKAELSVWVSGIGGRKSPPIVPIQRGQLLPLSFAQQRLWFLDQLEPGNAVYTMFTALRIAGRLNVQALAKSFNELVCRHEVLRTTFTASGGEPAQVIHSKLGLPLPVIDLSGLPREECEAEIRGIAAEEAGRPFDLLRGPLLRTTLLRLGDRGGQSEHVLLSTMHHIVSDDWSAALFFGELAALYEAFCAGQDSPLPPLPIQYADFAYWQRQWSHSEVLEGLVRYWKKQLAGSPPRLEWRSDRPRGSLSSRDSAVHNFSWALALTERLKALSRQQGVTLFMTLLAGLKTLLYRYTGQCDICIGTPIANRNRLETEGLIGFFVNTLVLRTNLSDNPRFTELLARVQEVALGAQAHQDMPFDKLVEELQPVRDLNHSPLFQVMFVLHNVYFDEPKISGLQVSVIDGLKKSTPFDLTLHVLESQGELTGWVEFNQQLFEHATIQRMERHLMNLLEGAIADPCARLSGLSLLTESERRQLLIEWNATGTDYPRDKCIHQLFEAQVERSPEAAAVVYESEQLTYAELNAKANQLAHHLRGLGVGADTLVGICAERSLEMVVGLLGILKAGGAYLPLDPTYPKERLAYMLEDARPSVLLTQARLRNSLPEHAMLLCLDSDWVSIGRRIKKNLCNYMSPENLAYVIYTSGSTGRPKGVAIAHRNTVALLAWANGVFTLEDMAGVLASTSLGFDLSVFELFVPLSRGGKAIVVKDALDLPTLPSEAGVTLVNTVPSAMKALGNGRGFPGSVRVVNLAGEALRRELVQQLYQQGSIERVLNLYGPSEATTYSSFAGIEAMGEESPAIGRPIDNTQIYLLDIFLEPVPGGVSSELYIGGAGLARGYLNRPELTAERFIPHPFGDTPGERLYRTGDLARYRPDGNLEYLGRMDHQVKVRGFRIELGEIEAALTEHAQVKEAVVLAREDSAGDKRLVAYVVGKESEPTAEELRTHVKEYLPEYMMPAVFVFLEALPLTPNGKVDRKALPASDLEAQLAHQYVAPRNATEEILANIWAEVLGVERVGIQDNFFELGGHSLLATQVISRVRTTFEAELPLRVLFELPTVGALGLAVEAAQREAGGGACPPLAPVLRTDELPLSHAQERLWFLDQLEPGSVTYNIPGALRLVGHLDSVAFERSINEIIRRHEALRTTFTMVEGQGVQLITPELKLAIPTLDLSQLPEEQREAEVRRLAMKEAGRPFDLSVGPLVRVSLLALGEDSESGVSEHVMLFTLHHIVSDGWSTDILVREFEALYDAFSQGRLSPLPELPIQYADYAVWQRAWLQGEVLARQLSYWKGQFAGAPEVLTLPTDRPRPAVQSYRGASYAFTLSSVLTEQLHVLSRREQVTLFMTLLAAFKVLLRYETRQNDIVVGTDVANRNRKEIEGLVGFFVNQLAVRTNLSGDPTFSELLRRVQQVTLDAYAHQDLPFEKLVEVLNPRRNLGWAPMFQIKIILQKVPQSIDEVSGLAVSTIRMDGTTADLDLLLDVLETSEGLNCLFEYNKDLFDVATIARYAEHIATVLRMVATDPNSTLKMIDNRLAAIDSRGQRTDEEQLKAANYRKLENIQRKAVKAQGITTGGPP